MQCHLRDRRSRLSIQPSIQGRVKARMDIKTVYVYGGAHERSSLVLPDFYCFYCSMAVFGDAFFTPPQLRNLFHWRYSRTLELSTFHLYQGDGEDSTSKSGARGGTYGPGYRLKAPT
ncbi:hypothetical protein AMECASPLE_031867 [Ameca splendens]|uniref:Uncharacterized protein n=1 Tax=Ameca splendens TaxID=208324 RepID=A0ABV0XVA5_9TELE